MIVPLKATISLLDQDESFEEEFKLPVEFGKSTRSPRYEVEMTALDTEKREIREWTFWSMEDKTRGSYDQVGQMRARAMLFADVVALRKLRDEIDELLEEPRLRWETFSDDELRELASLISAADESYDLSPGAERLSAEVKSESDNRLARAEEESDGD